MGCTLLTTAPICKQPVRSLGKVTERWNEPLRLYFSRNCVLRDETLGKILPVICSFYRVLEKGKKKTKPEEIT